jgi:hypothetical protein
MRINKNTNHTKRNYIIALTAILLLAGAATLYYLNNSSAQQSRENVVDYEPATKEQEAAGYDAKSDFNKKHYGEDSDNSANVDDKSNVGLVISSINQNEDMLTIASTIETVESGVCELNLTRPGAETVTMQVKVIRITSYSACEDFNVDTKNIEKGEWNIKIDYIGDSLKGTVSSKVDIK